MEFVMKGLITMAGVAVFLWIAERYGSGRAGWLTGLPSVSGPALLWLANEHGIGFVTAAAGGTVIGCALCAVFAGVLGLLLRRLSLALALLIAVAAMLALAGILSWLRVDLWLGSAFAVVVIIAMHALLPTAPSCAHAVGRAFRQGSLLVAIIAGIISGCLTATGGLVGPWWSGVIASLPLIAAAVTITCGDSAQARSVAFLRGYVGGLLGRIAFALCLVYTLSTAMPFVVGVALSSLSCVLLSAIGCRWLARINYRLPASTHPRAVRAVLAR